MVCDLCRCGCDDPGGPECGPGASGTVNAFGRSRIVVNMINAFMKSSGEKSFHRDLQRIDFSKIPNDKIGIQLWLP